MDEAVAAHRRAMEHAEALRWPAGVAAALRGIARVETSRRDFPAAVEAYERALELSERFGTRRQRATDLARLVDSLFAAKRSLDALPLAERALAEQEVVGTPSERGTLLLHLARLRVQFGERAEALALFGRARDQFAAAGDRRMAARARYEAARFVHPSPATHGSMLAEFDEVVAVARALGDLELEAQAESMRGILLGRLERHGEQIEALDRAVALAERTDDPHVQAVAWGAFAEGIARDDLFESLLAWQRVVSLLEGLGDRPGPAYTQLARVQQALGDFPGAIASSRKAVAVYREAAHRHGEGHGTGHQSRVRAVADVGAHAALLLWDWRPEDRPHATAVAFEFAEVSRATLLAEALATRPAPPAESAEVADLRRRVHEARRELLGLAFGEGGGERGHGERGSPPAPDATPLGPDASALARARRDLDAAAAALRTALARDELERRRDDAPPPPPVSIDEAQAALPEGTAIVLHQQVATRAWAVVVTRDGAHLVSLGSASAYEAAAKAWARAISSPDGEEGAHAEFLYDRLLAPLERLLPVGSTLLVSPDEPLAFLPFEAMVRHREGERTRAVERWQFAYVPSATAYVLNRRRGAAVRDALVALGDPVYPTERPGTLASDPLALSRGLADLDRLPATGDEVRELGALFPDDRRTLLLREEATRARLEAALGGVGDRLRVLHMACHGYADASDPLQSGLVLSDLDVLTVADVARARVPADVVVLSACDSGRGAVRRGEGTLGFVRAFLTAGARHVLVATQRVGDARTRELMHDFYEGLLRDGLPPARALARAKRARIAAGGPAAHPYAWSALVLWQ
jgi:CHAT domain-containing protein